MLNIKEAQSTNVVEISGILSQLEVDQAKTADGRNYASAKATIKVDQEIGGKMVENEIPVKLFSMEMKADGSAVSKIYTSILELPQKFISLASLGDDEKDKASKVVINAGNLKENIWVDPNSGQVRTGFEIDTNFMNAPRGNTEFEQDARFELSGVVMDMVRETDSNQEETGRLKVKMAVVGYTGRDGITRVDVIDLIAASDNAVNFIESNWEKGDTVNVNGKISFNQSTKVWYEEQGFGEPIKRTKTQTRKELIILGGSPSGLEEEYSYDATDIKKGLEARAARVEEQKAKSSTKGKAQTKKTTSFDDVNPGF
ncbi:MAG: hypothetical protein IKZ94_04315 [Lachnospiraceae bacterium]|nr:hypothetical protein [Lachnospiraceae bacterium]